MQKQAAPAGWRETLLIHPATEILPLMSAAELNETADDIKKNGLTTPIELWREDRPDAPLQLLEGRNRLDAIEIVYGPVQVNPPNIKTANGSLINAVGEHVKILPSSVDPWTYVVSVNVKRRHLTAKQKRDLIEKLLKAQPEKSNRQIAEAAKASHNTVGAVRTKLEGRGQIAHVEKRTDTKGRGQPARKGAKGAKTAGTKRWQAKKTADPKAHRNPKSKLDELKPNVVKTISAVKGLLKPFSPGYRKTICEHAIADLARRKK
jgi:hypothetical protein